MCVFTLCAYVEVFCLWYFCVQVRAILCKPFTKLKKNAAVNSSTDCVSKSFGTLSLVATVKLELENL